MKGKIYLRQQLLKDSFIAERYSKGLLVQLKNKLMDKVFVEDEDSPFQKVEPHRKFNIQWGTVYSRDLAEFTREEILEMCPEDVIDIHVPRRDDNSRLTEPPIIELEFDRDTLDPHIVIRRENFQLRMKKDQSYAKGAYSLNTQKN